MNIIPNSSFERKGINATNQT